MAACGRARGGDRLTATALPEARPAALGWLGADIAARSHLSRDTQAADRAQLLRVLGHWKVDSELAGDRDAWALAGLSEAECPGWLALWREIDELIASLKAGAGTGRPVADSGFPATVRGFLDPPG